MISIKSNAIVLSVIIPTCNRNNTLPRAIYSVLNQSVVGLEVVVVNDSNNEFSDEIINISDDYPVRFITNSGRHGAASARNYGVSKAMGEYITFLDDDDMYLPGRLNNMLELIKKDKYIMVSSGRFYETGDLTTIKLASRQFFGEITLQNIKYQNDIDIGFMMKRDVFLRFNGFDDSYKSLEDWDFISRVLAEGKCYKIQRMDYVVNFDSNRPRVSDNDSVSYLKMANAYKNKNGHAWYSYMISHGLSIAGKFNIFTALNLVIKNFSLWPLIIYVRQIKRKITRLF